MWKKRVVYRVLVGRLEGKRQLGRSRRRWEDNIKMDLQGVECEGDAPPSNHSTHQPAEITHVTCNNSFNEAF
jgi:hypothetical protein